MDLSDPCPTPSCRHLLQEASSKEKTFRAFRLSRFGLPVGRYTLGLDIDQEQRCRRNPIPTTRGPETVGGQPGRSHSEYRQARARQNFSFDSLLLIPSLHFMLFQNEKCVTTGADAYKGCLAACFPQGSMYLLQYIVLHVPDDLFIGRESKVLTNFEKPVIKN